MVFLSFHQQQRTLVFYRLTARPHLPEVKIFVTATFIVLQVPVGVDMGSDLLQEVGIITQAAVSVQAANKSLEINIIREVCKKH